MRDKRYKASAMLTMLGWVAMVALMPSHAKATEPAVQPEAIKALTDMGAHLRTLKSFALSADTVQEDALDNGQTIQISGHIAYQVRMPDKLTLTVNRDNLHRAYFYDGKTVTQFARDGKLYAVFDAPDTIVKAIDLAYERYGLSLPLADLFYVGTDDDKLKAISSARLVGQSMLDGQICNHYAYRQPRVDFEVWIRKDGDPIPCELVVTDTTDPARPKNGALITIDPMAQFPDSTFTFVPPDGALKIDMEPVAGVPASGN